MSAPVVTIGPTAIAVPQYRLMQEEVKNAVGEMLAALQPERRAAALAMFDSAGVTERYSVVPLAEVRRRRDLDSTMAVYRAHAVRLGRQVAAEALQRSEVDPRAVDLVITVSCTGFMIPSLDAHLVNDLGLRPDVRRMPLTQLGCTGGAAALVHAHDFLVGHPGADVLVVSVELPTLSFQSRNVSPANLVSTALFGDGAAAVVVRGREGPGARVLGTRSHTVPDSLGALGFDLRGDGFHVVLARELPDLLGASVATPVEALLAGAGVPRAALAGFVLHPGGPRILHALEQALGLTAVDTRSSWTVLRRFGNVSSAAVLFVLHQQIHAERPAPGAHLLVGGFGPGLSSELLLVRWN